MMDKIMVRLAIVLFCSGLAVSSAEMESKIDMLSAPKEYTDMIISYLSYPLEISVHSINKIIKDACELFFYPLNEAFSLLSDLLNGSEKLLQTIIDSILYGLDMAIKKPLLFVKLLVISLVEYLIHKPIVFIIRNIFFLISMPLHAIAFEDLFSYLSENVVIFIISAVFIIIETLISICIDFPVLIIELLLTVLVKYILFAVLSLPFAILHIPVILLSLILNIVSFDLHHILSVAFNIVFSLIIFILTVIVFVIVFIIHWTLEIFLGIMLLLIGAFLWILVMGMGFSVYVLKLHWSGKMREDKWMKLFLKQIKKGDYSVMVYLRERLPISENGCLWKQTEELLRTNEGVEEENEEEEEVNECIVCFEDDPLITLLPCRHRNICRNCFEEIYRINRKCPLCRIQIFGFISA